MIDLIDYVAMLFGVSPEDMFSKKRERNSVDAVHVCMLIMRENTLATIKDIAGVFNRDHATTIYAVKKARELYEVDKYLKQKIDNVRAMVSGNLVLIPLADTRPIYEEAKFEEEYLTLVQ